MSQEQIVRFREGQTIFEQGERTRDMYILQAGKVRVYLSQGERRIPLTDLGRGSFVGEMSFLSGQPRTATVEAVEPVVANRITPKLMKEEAMGLPGWIVTVAQVLVQRLKKTTSILGDYLQADDPEAAEGSGGQPKAGEADGDDSGGDPVKSHRKEGRGRDPFRLDVVEKDSRLYLQGYFSEEDVAPFHSRLRKMKGRKGEVVIDFSGVMDVDRKAVGYLTKLARVKDSSLRIRFENVQLIREKISAIRNISRMVVKTKLPEREIAEGETLIRQGDSDKMMYIIREGRFRVIHEADGKTMELETLGEGDVTGEMAIIRRGERSASVVADTAGRVAEIDADHFYNNGYNIPAWFLQIIQGLVHRIRETHQMLDDAVARQEPGEAGESVGASGGGEADETVDETVDEPLPGLSEEGVADEASGEAEEFDDSEPAGEAGDGGVPLVMELNPSQPGTIRLKGDLTFENLDYLAIMIGGLKEREICSVELVGEELASADPSAASYFVNLHMELQKMGGGLTFSGFSRDFLDVFQGS